MPRLLNVTNSFNAVAPGQKATLDLPVGPLVYHGLRIYYGTATVGGPTRANMEAEITNIRLMIDGIAQREFSAAELFAVNALKGRAVQDGLLPIFFSEPWRRAAQGEDSLAWGMANIQTFQIEVEIAGGATSPTLKALAHYEEVNRPLGPIVKWNRYVVPVTATGLTNWNPPKTDAVYALHCFSGNISDIEVNLDQKDVFKATQTEADDLYSDFGLTPQASLFPVLFDPTRRTADALPMYIGSGSSRRQVSQFQIDFNMSVAASFTVLTETLGPRNG